MGVELSKILRDRFIRYSIREPRELLQLELESPSKLEDLFDLFIPSKRKLFEKAVKEVSENYFHV